MIEVIAKSIEDIKDINETKADRIELCSEMKLGGVTPALSFIKEALKVTQKPLMIMIRLRDGFDITENEVIELENKIKTIKNINSKYLRGFVFGYNKNNEYDEDTMCRLIKISQPYKVTYHKASDVIVKDIINFKNKGIDCILTQGGEDNIINNTQEIKRLIKDNPGVEILLGGGVNLDNYEELKKISKSIHVGSCVRENESYEHPISKIKIDKLF